MAKEMGCLQQEGPGSDLTKNFLVKKEIRYWVGKDLGWLQKKKKNLRVLETSHKFRVSAEGHFQRMQR